MRWGAIQSGQLGFTLIEVLVSLLILAVMSVFGWRWFETIIGQSDDALRQAALTRNNFAALKNVRVRLIWPTKR